MSDIAKQFFFASLEFSIWQSDQWPTSYGPPPEDEDAPDYDPEKPRHDYCGYPLDANYQCPRCDFFRALHEGKNLCWPEDVARAYGDRLKALGAGESVMLFLMSQPTYDMLNADPATWPDEKLVADIAWAKGIIPKEMQEGNIDES